MENQNQGTPYQQQYVPPQPTFTAPPELEEPVSVKEWLITFLILIIPIVNIVMLFVWAFGDGKKSKQNYFKAYLIWIGIIIVLYILLLILFGSILFSIGSNM